MFTLTCLKNMMKLKVLVIILIFKYSTASPCYEYYPEWYCDHTHEDDYNDGITDPEFDYDNQYISNRPDCPEDQSLLSSDDLSTLIDYVVNKSHIVEDIITSYHEKSVALNLKYLDQLNDFQDRAEQKQDHLKHILEYIEETRQKLEPIGHEIATEIERIDKSDEDIDLVDIHLDKALNKFHIFQELCEINGINDRFVNRLRHNKHVSLNAKPICGNIKSIYEKIMKQLDQLRDQGIAMFSPYIDFLDNHIKNSVISYNNKLKEGALRQFDKLMYDILTLQDDYLHLNQYFSDFNVSLKLDAIENNINKVNSILEEIENDVNEFGKKCMNFNKKLRFQRGIFESRNYLDDFFDSEDIIETAISFKLKEIENIVINNFTNIFKDLDDRLTNPEVIESYIKQLSPKEEYVNDVEKAREEMNELKNLIPQSSIEKLQDLYDKSEKLLEKAEKAKEEINAKNEHEESLNTSSNVESEV